jgi:hypothetical protein
MIDLYTPANTTANTNTTRRAANTTANTQLKAHTSHSDQDNYNSEDDLDRAFQVEERKRRNRWTKRKLHKSNQPRRMSIPTGSKSTANEDPSPDEEMQWKYEVDEFGEANGIDNELKIWRWVIQSYTR